MQAPPVQPVPDKMHNSQSDALPAPVVETSKPAWGIVVPTPTNCDPLIVRAAVPAVAKVTVLSIGL